MTKLAIKTGLCIGGLAAMALLLLSTWVLIPYVMVIREEGLRLVFNQQWMLLLLSVLGFTAWLVFSASILEELWHATLAQLVRWDQAKERRAARRRIDLLMAIDITNDVNAACVFNSAGGKSPAVGSDTNPHLLTPRMRTDRSSLN